MFRTCTSTCVRKLSIGAQRQQHGAVIHHYSAWTRDEPRQDFVPDVVDDDSSNIDGEGNGSDAYHAEYEPGERWDAPTNTALMRMRINGQTPAQIYASYAAPISYYIRMNSTPDGNYARLIRHRDSILPFCEVSHLVNPSTLLHTFDDPNNPPPEIPREAWDRMHRAACGVDLDGAKILASVFHSPANLRAIDSKMAALSSVCLRESLGGDPPDYKNRWARSTAAGYHMYLKATKAQHAVVRDGIGKAMLHISRL
ncbi:MAG: hypothetical protein Q9181_008039 [Wetmoreana brouardii]